MHHPSNLQVKETLRKKETEQKIESMYLYQNVKVII